MTARALLAAVCDELGVRYARDANSDKDLVDTAIGNTFANCLRAILRQDPDRILVGEIRDIETGEIAIQAALTGHLVLSTIHTNSAWATISRLIDMGIPAFLIASTLDRHHYLRYSKSRLASYECNFFKACAVASLGIRRSWERDGLG